MADEYERGQAFGPYVLEARLGGGGFGTVWRARESATGQLVALKILAGKFSAGETSRLRADVELLAAAASSGSEHVVKVLGGGAEPAPHVVMEFIEGSNLEDELERQGKLSQAESLRVLHGLAEALGVLHDAGIIHRDVKPANVMLARDGTVKLTDFGIAKIAGYESVTATGQLPLSAAYAAPEVWAGEATYQSDFYALGAMTFQCLTGARPFSGNFVQLFEMHRNRDPDYGLLPGEIVPALRRLIVECLRKEPGDRPHDAEALLALIAEAEGQLSTPSEEPVAAATHAPRALGPWLIESPHPDRPWTYRCLHETSGERATVEVHFSDSLDLGEQLKRAVSVNPALVPLGAERLLGTNRLILRPGEAWPDQPAGRFAFWVARQELPAPPSPGPLIDAEQLAAGRSALALSQAAANAGLAFGLHEREAKLGSGGAVYATRVGLPGGEARPVVEWLRAALPGVALFGMVTTDEELAARLVAAKAVEPGVARVAETGALSEVVEQSGLVERSGLAPRPMVAEPAPEAVVEQEPELQPGEEELEPWPATEPPSPSAGRHWQMALWMVGAVVAGGLAAAAALLLLGGDDNDPAGCNDSLGSCDTATPTRGLSVTPTKPPSATVTPTPPLPPGMYEIAAGDFCGSIAADHGVSLQQMLAANSMTEDDCLKIQIGQRLVMPVPWTPLPTATPTPTPTVPPEPPRPPATPGPGGGMALLPCPPSCGQFAGNYVLTPAVESAGKYWQRVVSTPYGYVGVPWSGAAAVDAELYFCFYRVQFLRCEHEFAIPVSVGDAVSTLNFDLQLGHYSDQLLVQLRVRGTPQIIAAVVLDVVVAVPIP